MTTALQNHASRCKRDEALRLGMIGIEMPEPSQYSRPPSAGRRSKTSFGNWLGANSSVIRVQSALPNSVKCSAFLPHHHLETASPNRSLNRTLCGSPGLGFKSLAQTRPAAKCRLASTLGNTNSESSALHVQHASEAESIWKKRPGE